MTLTLLSTITQVLVEDIVPVTTNPIIWMIISALIILLILRYVWFPCLSLQALDATIKDVGNLLKEYEQSIRSHCLSDMMDYNHHKQSFKDYEDQLLRIKGIAHKRFDEDYKAATWKKYISFSRAAIISASYKKLWVLREDIEATLQVLTEDIIPIASSPTLWMIMSLLVLALILRYVWLPYLSLQTLDATIKDVGKLLEGYEQNIQSQCLSDTIDYDQHKRS
ncbi:hypothetical protein GYMLUDRAFT_245618 [Collybiopsis luxurians FD-317 M1]|uniref:Uncharacterized protein n=1 Tax=Collybiopsis luxurians FD-317 M1 TaxID=944289 RepID=A0A0D0BUN2_9AGAR|nr:hypothetical protein GYMLUDRAFT_245618 [Collybiopsis luxurians FD-317 M1]